MPTVLITGANRGLGLEFARQYAADGWRVLATSRGPMPDQMPPGDIVHQPLDVGDFDAVDRLAGMLSDTPIDLLINNAGIMGPRGLTVETMDFDAWANVLHVNSLAPFKVIQAFLPHLRAGTGRKIANLTSKMGSMGDNGSGGSYIYRSSKAALNAHLKSLAIDLAGEGIMLAILHPGWARTDMGGAGGLIDAYTSVAGMRTVINLMGPTESGRFFAYDGKEIPW